MTIDVNQKACLDAMGIDVWRLRKPNQSSVDQKTKSQPVVVDEAPLVNWESLRNAVSQCRLCGLCEHRQNTVFGVGSKTADLMIIGEAPGANEDREGEPFVGRAGQLLTEMLKAIDIKREAIFIANILKCRPPNNRDPSPEEVATCTPYLKQQIDLLRPKLIVAVGRIAAQFLLDTKESLSHLRGKPHEYENIPLLVTYHPAYLLRSPKEKGKALQDLYLIERFFKRA